jgi:rhamnose transport system ATP-binding protein
VSGRGGLETRIDGSIEAKVVDALNPKAVPAIRLEGISKSFPGVKALSGVQLGLYPGQVTALIGENGAGKSTLVKILTGIYQPDEGELIYKGTPTKFPTAHAALKAGITAIHQETVLFDELSVAENIFLGHQPLNRFGLIDWNTMYSRAKKLLEAAGASFDPRTRLRDLGIASRHLVAIARALSVDAQVVIMDEPTAALSQKEIHELYELVHKLKAAGKAILFISHKFDEIFEICDRYTVFRDGQMVGEGLIRDISENDLVRMMVGRDISQVFPKKAANIGAPVLSVSDYCHPTEFETISFDLRRGEILGFYGLVGAGRTEFMQSLFGITKPSKGTVKINGESAVIRTASQAIRNGIVYVPEERGRQGAMTTMPIFQNVTLPSLRRTSRRGLLRLAEEFRLAREYTSRLDLRAASLDQDVGTLSGGNQQKVVIAKWLATKPKVIILDEPTKGIDIGSKAAVHEFMSELATQGLSVIMVSSEIPEIIGMSDRVIVMRQGRIAGEYAREGLTAETLVRAAAGIGEAA